MICFLEKLIFKPCDNAIKYTVQGSPRRHSRRDIKIPHKAGSHLSLWGIDRPSGFIFLFLLCLLSFYFFF